MVHLLPLLAAVLVKQAAATTCDCYLSDGSAAAYFRNHGFWDFRSLSQYAGVPPVIDSIDGNLHANHTSDFFVEDSDFTKFWTASQYGDASADFPDVLTYNNLYIQKDTDAGGSNTFLTMRTTRLPNFQTDAGLNSKEKYLHASIRMHARVRGSSGACASVFTYLSTPPGAPLQESDIEILTKEDAHIIHYTNQPSSVQGGAHVVELNGATWEDWATHRLDWTQGNTTYYFNTSEMIKSGFQVPVDPSLIIMDMWSNGGSWSGKMDLGGEAYMHVQWVEILYDEVNSSDCTKVCTIQDPGVVTQK